MRCEATFDIPKASLISSKPSHLFCYTCLNICFIESDCMIYNIYVCLFSLMNQCWRCIGWLCIPYMFGCCGYAAQSPEAWICRRIPVAGRCWHINMSLLLRPCPGEPNHATFCRCITILGICSGFPVAGRSQQKRRIYC